MLFRSDRVSAPQVVGTLFIASVLLCGGIAAASGAPSTSKASEGSETQEQVQDQRALSTANAKALPHTYRVSLTIEEGKETLAFSTVTATRHFSLAPPERRLRLRGRLWLQADGRELFDFSVELGQQMAQRDGSSAVASEGHWSGSAYVESDQPIQIVENPNSRITIKLTKQ